MPSHMTDVMAWWCGFTHDARVSRERALAQACKRVCTIICAAAVLHNICMAQSAPLPVEDFGTAVEHIREQVAEEDVTARFIRSNTIWMISLSKDCIHNCGCFNVREIFCGIVLRLSHLMFLAQTEVR